MYGKAGPYRFLKTPQGLTLRYGRWSYAGDHPNGTVLLLQGRSEFLEKYEETVGDLLERRMDVLSFDWRGQGLSDRILPESEKGFIKSYRDYLDDLDFFIKIVVRPAARGLTFLMSHSMGGHIGLRYLHQYDHPFQKAVFCAPMIDIMTGPIPKSLARWVIRRAAAKGKAHDVIASAARNTPFPDKFKGNRFTTDQERFLRTRETITGTPRLSAANVTFGWLAATYNSIDVLNQPGVPRDIDTPLLFVCAGKDRIVSNKAIFQFEPEVPNSRLAIIKDARHEILQGSDHQRDQFWKVFDDFVFRWK
jgi:lysophospholipase